ncbi:zinc finger BED domain-containing protein 5-like [Sipha flava]|uniref:Zinc finger BED domain-containing protein 5-like n=1 Tax=Sipha flava TaxID=143950 RepID=A0A8B8GAF5_9HEMI|nr:zinc finger BED domain-containing protein 5-like [Sipha flava]
MKGNVLSRLFELRQELYSYLNGEGKETHILQLYDKIVAFIKKINLWKRKLTEENGKTICFPLLKYFLGENDLELPMSLKTIFLEHLTNLETHFMKYFPEEMKLYYWIKDPLTEKPLSNFTTTEEEQLIDISSDSSLRMQFSSYSLLGFWNNIKDEYPEVSNKALRILIPFATSYLCEAGFSAVAVLKSKYRSKLNVDK